VFGRKIKMFCLIYEKDRREKKRDLFLDRKVFIIELVLLLNLN